MRSKLVRNGRELHVRSNLQWLRNWLEWNIGFIELEAEATGKDYKNSFVVLFYGKFVSWELETGKF